MSFEHDRSDVQGALALAIIAHIIGWGLYLAIVGGIIYCIVRANTNRTPVGVVGQNQMMNPYMTPGYGYGAAGMAYQPSMMTTQMVTTSPGPPNPVTTPNSSNV